MTNAKKFLIFSFIIYSLTLIYSCSLQNYTEGKYLCLYGHCVQLKEKRDLYELNDSAIEDCREFLKYQHMPGIAGRYGICNLYEYEPGCPCYGLEGKINE